MMRGRIRAGGEAWLIATTQSSSGRDPPRGSAPASWRMVACARRSSSAVLLCTPVEGAKQDSAVPHLLRGLPERAEARLAEESWMAVAGRQLSGMLGGGARRAHPLA